MPNVITFYIETLRKYPVLPMINRTCLKEYQIPGTDKIIEKGVEVYISVLGLHRDAGYYQEPDKYNLVRFSAERSAGKNLSSRPYIPFGDGPRNCIGMRFGKLQTKVALVSMLLKFKYHLQDNDKNRELKFDPRHFLLQTNTNIYLHIIRR